jgi:hypothetical protein
VERYQRKDMEMLTGAGIPVKLKSMTKAPSLTPNPEMETGTIIMVMIIGTKTKSSVNESLCPMLKAIAAIIRMRSI